jgi:hypothetical protein
MRDIGIAACAIVVLAGGAAIAMDRHERDQRLVAGFVDPAGSQPPRAVVRGCTARIGAASKRRDDDTVIGPLRFNMQEYSPPRKWRRMVRSGQWLKSVARVRAGAQVTLEVPPEQRAWMRLRYAQRRGGAAAITLRACRHRRSREAQRRECGWAEGVAGPPGAIRDDYTACRTGPTSFSGGFEIDYANAPQQGRCAELMVWVKGEENPHRVRLLRVEPGECVP